MSDFIDWDAQQGFQLDKILPPPDGMVVVGTLGTVVMSKKTFQAFQDYAEGAEIEWESKANGD